MFVGSKPEKIAKLKAASQWFKPGRRVSGRQLEVIIGLFTHEFLFNRGALSIFRAAYTFIQDSYYFKQPLWDSVAREIIVAGNVLPLCRTFLDCQWDSEIVCTDASPNGWGTASCIRPISEVKSIGCWQENWRYRRLDPSEWAPRRRALNMHSALDLVSDPRTLGNQLSCVHSDGYDIPIPSEFDFVERKGFPEVSQEGWEWRVGRFGRFKYSEHIGAKEARVAVWALERSLRDPNKHRSRLVRLVDNFGVARLGEIMLQQSKFRR